MSALEVREPGYVVSTGLGRNDLSCPSSGPVTDQLVRKAYVAGYDRRLRHPAWVCHTVLFPYAPYFFNSGSRRQNTSPNLFSGKVPVLTNQTLATGRRATSRRMKAYRQCFAPNCRTTSGVGTTGDTWFLPPMPSCLRRPWTKRSCYPILRRRSALGSTAIVSCLVR